MKAKSFIECDDYNVGSFHPKSFNPILNWKIATSKFIDSSSKLPRLIIIRSKLIYYTITISSNPYGFGEFTCESRLIGFGEYWLKTNDPEEAIYITEALLKHWIIEKIDYYEKLQKGMKNGKSSGKNK